MDTKIILQFAESRPPLLRDVSSLLYDLELAYDFGVLLTEPGYRRFKFSRFFWFRNGRPLSDGERLRAPRIALRSPLLLEVTATSLTGIWILIQIIKSVQNWPLEREKLELEVEKLRREQLTAHVAVIDKYAEDFRQLIVRRDVEDINDRITQRLDESEFRLKQLEIKFDGDRRDSRIEREE